ncbi:MAG: hypothetical protein M3R25_14290 [Bacteroidota bacterium]|nr:hypothetical protein [Bacteroidota bacterium]
MKIFTFLLFFISFFKLDAQTRIDPWIASQLGRIQWQQTFEGVLADYHPVTLILAYDSAQIAGVLIHKSDQRIHRLLGDRGKKDLFQLQERDEYDRLTGYLNGSISADQLHLEWMSADKSRLFDIVAYPSSIIKIKNFKPIAEWIKVDLVPEMYLSVQKMDYGIVSGIAKRNSEYSRFEGYCLDGSCSIWNTIIQNPGGAPIKLQMRQKDASIYKAVLDGKEYSASILKTFPLSTRHYDNSMGFLDFVYPELESPNFSTWLGSWLDKGWNDGISHLTSMNQPGSSGRLIHRSSGWIEIIDEADQYISGVITYINPGSIRRESFVWLKKDDLFLTASDLLNTPQDLAAAGNLLITRSLPHMDQDPEYNKWLTAAGYTHIIPSATGAVMLTDFSMTYGDNIRKLPVTESKTFFKKKYWRYFGW